MDKQFEKKYHDIETSHWWFLARRDMILRLLKGVPKDAKILDIGCSGGILLSFLRSKGFKQLYGIDMSNEAIKECKQKGLKNVSVQDALNMKFKKDSFDVIIISDVLECIKQDRKALKEWARISHPKGKMLLFVSAFPFLYGEHDVINHAVRRYAPKVFKKRIQEHFTIQKFSFWNFTMFFPSFFLRVWQKAFKPKQVKDQLYLIPQPINALFKGIVNMENSFLGIGNLPIGVSLFAVARKK